MDDVNPWYGIIPLATLALTAFLLLRAWAVRRHLIGAPPKRLRLPKSRLRWD